MQIDLEPIRRALQAEVEEDLAIVEQELLALEKAPDDTERVASIFRKFHSLKGNAAGLGLERLSGFAHRIEDLLDGVRSGEEKLTSAHVSFVLQVVDALRRVCPAIGRGEDQLPPHAEELLRRVAGRRLLAADLPVADPEADPAAETGTGTLRIDVSRLDTLLGVTSEIAIARGRLELLIEREGSAEMAAAYRALQRLLGELHRSVTKVRMVPIAPLLRHYSRVVRDLALAQGKRAELVIEDFGVEVDTSVIDRLRAPLTHMVRNAVHHGLEKEEVRRAAGKAAQGRITLRARHEGAEIVIEVEDDGAGIDRGRLLERARALGVATDALQAPQEIDDLIFVQGLSTAREVSGTSGRGVGMDVVRRHIDSLGGSVSVSSDPGAGTRIAIRMPLTLAIIEGLIGRVGDASVVIPMAGVVRCLDRPAGRGEATDGVAEVAGRPVPFVRLHEAFGVASEGGREVLIVLQKGGESLGVAVDRLLGRAQVVVKPPGRFFSDLPAVSGLTILGDGQVAPVLNLAGLVSAHRERREAVGKAAVQP
jgi:two-component system chemotaxis sensor kinase CheA